MLKLSIRVIDGAYIVSDTDTGDARAFFTKDDVVVYLDRMKATTLGEMRKARDVVEMMQRKIGEYEMTLTRINHIRTALDTVEVLNG